MTRLDNADKQYNSSIAHRQNGAVRACLVAVLPAGVGADGEHTAAVRGRRGLEQDGARQEGRPLEKLDQAHPRRGRAGEAGAPSAVDSTSNSSRCGRKLGLNGPRPSSLG